MKARTSDQICILVLAFHNEGAGGVAGNSTYNGYCHKDIKIKRSAQRERRAFRANGDLRG